MTPELMYLLLSSVLLTVLWIPYIIGLVRSEGVDTPETYRNLRQNPKLPVWVQRANRAHLNLVEQFAAFAGVVVVAHLSGVSTPATVLAAAVFFWARVAHALIMLAGVGSFKARTISFTIAFASILVIAFETFRNAL